MSAKTTTSTNSRDGFSTEFSFLQERPTKKLFAQRGARTHDPEIKSLMLYRLS